MRNPDDGTVSRTAANRNDHVSAALHAELAEHLRSEPVFVLTRALRNIPMKREVATGGSRDAIERWERLLRSGDLAGIRAIFLGDDEDSRMMRNSTVFQGVLTQRERETVLRGVVREPRAS